MFPILYSLDSGMMSDVVFLVRGKELRAHKQTLAAKSPVFEAMFEDDFLEKKNGLVQIEDIDPDVFEVMLKFIYNPDQIEPKMQNMADQLLVAADKVWRSKFY